MELGTLDFTWKLSPSLLSSSRQVPAVQLRPKLTPEGPKKDSSFFLLIISSLHLATYSWTIWARSQVQKFFCTWIILLYLHFKQLPICYQTTPSCYHEAKPQLCVCLDFTFGCDLCSYKGISVWCISPDRKWQRKCIPELESCFDDIVITELVWFCISRKKTV